MRILHLIYDHPKNPWVGGGGAVRVYEICRRLARMGHEVAVVSGNYPGASDYAEGALSYRFVGSRRGYALSTFSYALRAAAFVRKYGGGFDVVVEDFAPWNPVFSRFLTRTPAVLHVNHREGLGILRRLPLWGLPFYLVERFYPQLFGRVTALSEGTRGKLAKPGVVVVPAGISEEIIAGGDAPASDEGFALFVGRLHMKNKGLDTLMDAMREAKGLRLRVVGRGPDEQRVRESARGLDVQFSGYVGEQEKLGFLRRASFLVLPSRFEGWGIVVLEAAACGKPSLVSGIPELSFATEGGFGLSFRVGDASDLARKMTLLMKDAAMRTQMGLKAKEYVKNYTWERITAEYEVYLLEAAARGR